MQGGDFGVEHVQQFQLRIAAQIAAQQHHAFGGAALALVGVQQALGGQAEVIRVCDSMPCQARMASSTSPCAR